MLIVKRVVLGLLAVAVSAVIVVGLAIWWIRANRVTATAMFRISSERPTVLADEAARRRDERNYDIIKKSQLAALKSYFVLTAALRNPGIAALPTFASVDDPVTWLEEHLEVEYPEDGEYLAIGLSGPASQSDELVLIVNAVAKAYCNEVVYQEKQRQLDQHKLLVGKLEKVNAEFSQKSNEVLEILKRNGAAGSDPDQISEQPGVILLDRIRPNGAQRPDMTLPHAGQLSDGVRQVIIGGEASTELNALKRELTALDKIASELVEKLKRMEIEADMPPRAVQVQDAIVEE
jgi:hypothetical protein